MESAFIFLNLVQLLKFSIVSSHALNQNLWIIPGLNTIFNPCVFICVMTMILVSLMQKFLRLKWLIWLLFGTYKVQLCECWDPGRTTKLKMKNSTVTFDDFLIRVLVTPQSVFREHAEIIWGKHRHTITCLCIDTTAVFYTIAAQPTHGSRPDTERTARRWFSLPWKALELLHAAVHTRFTRNSCITTGGKRAEEKSSKPGSLSAQMFSQQIYVTVQLSVLQSETNSTNMFRFHQHSFL